MGRVREKLRKLFQQFPDKEFDFSELLESTKCSKVQLWFELNLLLNSNNIVRKWRGKWLYKKNPDKCIHDYIMTFDKNKNEMVEICRFCKKLRQENNDNKNDKKGDGENV